MKSVVRVPVCPAADYIAFLICPGMRIHYWKTSSRTFSAVCLAIDLRRYSRALRLVFLIMYLSKFKMLKKGSGIMKGGLFKHIFSIHLLHIEKV